MPEMAHHGTPSNLERPRPFACFASRCHLHLYENRIKGSLRMYTIRTSSPRPRLTTLLSGLRLRLVFKMHYPIEICFWHLTLNSVLPIKNNFFVLYCGLNPPNIYPTVSSFIILYLCYTNYILQDMVRQCLM